jgi:hypothetical protein
MQDRTSRAARRFSQLIALACLTVVWTTAQADVTIKQKMSSKGLGGFLDTEMTTEAMISGDKECENSEIKMGGKLMEMFGAPDEPVQTSTITRLDKDIVWEVMHAEETYSEEKLSDKKARMEQFKAAFGDEDMVSGDSSMVSGSDNVEWGPPKFSVESTGKSETIAGQKCDQSIVAMEMEGTHKETGEKVKMHLTMDMFLARDVAGLDEMQAFGARKAKALGEDETQDQSPAFGMMEMLKEYNVDSDELLKQAEKLEGYPFRMTVEMRGEGAQFDQSPSGMSEAEQAEMEEAMEAMKNFGGLFGASDSGAAEVEKDDEPMIVDTSGALFKLTTEVLVFSTSAIKPSSFDPPPTYKKVDPFGEEEAEDEVEDAEE